MSRHPHLNVDLPVECNLIDGYLQGEGTALGTVDRWIDLVLRRYFRFLHGDWDDLRQEIRVRVIGNLSRGRFRGRSVLHTYIHRIARNVCIDFIRSSRRDREQGLMVKAEESGLPRSQSKEESAWLARDLLIKILGNLSQEERRLIRLVFVEHCSYAEVALHLGVSESSVKSKMFRCRQRILRMRENLMKRNGNHDLG